MQYPIIDKLIYAYLENGWTGLELTEGKNLLYSNDIIITNNGVTWVVENQIYTSTGIPTATSFSPPSITIEVQAGIYTMSFYGNNNNVRLTVVRNNAWFRSIYINESYTFTLNESANISIYLSTLTNGINSDGEFMYQLEKGTEPTPYEPYAPPTTDIKNRMKLPMIHYFPHPVIDAIISAADGQHTEEEKEILRHYLTPLGIGGI